MDKGRGRAVQPPATVASLGDMTTDIALVLGLVAVSLLLFAYERMRIDATAVLIMTTLMLTGLLTPEEALMGFSNVATVTVAAMFVLSAGLRQTGALTGVARRLGRVGERNEWMALGSMMVGVAVLSALMNNTAVVAMFIPLVVRLSRDIGVSPSRLLIPLSFASMFGGAWTLIGTSTNLLVDAIAVEAGIPRLGVFEFLPLGLVLTAVGFVYLFATNHLIPERRPGGGQELMERFELAPFLARLRLADHAPGVGATVVGNPLHDDLGLEIVDVRRDGVTTPATMSEQRLQAGDVVLVRGSANDLDRALARTGISLVAQRQRPEHDEEVESRQEALVEVVIAPDSQLGGLTIDQVNFPGRHHAQVLALRSAGQLQESLSDTRLRGGDSLLVRIDRGTLAELHDFEDFVVVSQVELPHLRRQRLPAAVAVVVAVVGLAAFGVLPIVVTAVAGSLAMVGIGALTAEEAYESINWKVVFLLAGVIPLGAALEQTGGAALLADLVVGGLQRFGPWAVLAGVFLATQLLTAVISNNASAVLLAPIALQAASTLDVSPRPFLFAVAVAASMSFATPIGYQTNTMIYGPGHYRFSDFVRIGGPLTLVVLVTAVIAIPLIWPF